MAQAVRGANRRVTDKKTGIRMVVEVRKVPLPYVPVESDEEASLKVELLIRYCFLAAMF